MRRLIGATFMVLAAVSAAVPAGADIKGEKNRPEQKEDGDVILTVGSDGSVSQPAPRGGRLECTLHDIVGDVGEGSVAIGTSIDPAVQLDEGWYYWLVCTDATGQRVVARIFRYEPGVSIVTPEELAQRATRELAIRHPVPRTSPSLTIDQIVGIDTWMWIDPEAWQPITATAAIPGMSVSATATPRRVVWDMGDGTVVTCDGPGTPFDDERPEADQSTDCSHVYQDRGVHTASATIVWAVTWTASDGGGGSLADVRRTTQFPMRVAERQAVGRD